MPTPPQPLEIVDFSGGITENILGGDPRRCARADNLLITVDKMLLGRPAIVPIDNTNYILPSGHVAVNGMYSFINETILFAQSARNLYYIPASTGIWTSVLGPSGNEPIQGGDDTAQTTFGEYGHQVYFASADGLTGLGILPSKIYRDTTNTWQALTAGLPRSFVSPSFNNQTLLNSCLTLANALRASFVAHFQDAVNTAGFVTATGVVDTGASYPSNASNIHLNQDYYSLSYFQTVSYSGFPDSPSPVPTPAVAATSESTLYLLVTALSAAYEHHRKDALAGVNGNVITANGVTTTIIPQYHYCTSIWGYSALAKYTRAPAGPHIALNSYDAPTTLTLAANALNDILQKWNWHRKAVWTHSPLNTQSQFNKYIPAASKIAPIFLSKTYPTITPNLTDLYTYANNLKTLFNYHINNLDASTYAPYVDLPQTTKYAHGMLDTSLYGYKQQITLDNVTNEDDFALMTYWLRTMYQMHFTDANNAGGWYAATYAYSAGSPTFTGIIYYPAGAVASPTVNMFTQPVDTTAGPVGGGLTQRSQLIISLPAAHQATIDANMRLTDAAAVTQFSFSYSMYHTNTPAYLAPVAGQITKNLEQSSDQLAISSFSSSTTTDGWLLLLNDFFNGFTNHVNYSVVHYYRQYPLVIPASSFPASILLGPLFIPKLSALAYAFIYTHTYTVETGGIEYEVLSNPVFSDSLILAQSLPINYTVPVNQAQAEAQAAGTPLPYPQAIIKNTYGNVITGLPSVVNVSNTNYDVANIKLEIYRTVDGGSTFYKIASLANGTTSYTDLTSDNVVNGNLPALTSNATIYTSGGVVAYDQPPISKYVHFFNNTAYYGAITDTEQFFPNRIIQSNQNSPDHAPATFFDDLGDNLTGLSSTKSNLIALCSNSIYRMSNGFNSLGQGSLNHDRISDVIGCLNSGSIVKTEVGVFFAGTDGFYYTDGYQLIPITIELKKTYNALTESSKQKQGIKGAYDKETRRIWWSMRSSPTSKTNDVSYVFYLDFGIKPSGSFTRITNLLYYQPASMVFQNGTMYMGHANGYVMKSNEDAKSDSKIDTTLAAASWISVYIPYNYTSIALDVGTTFKRKYITKIHAVGENAGNAAIQPKTIRDLNADGIGIYSLAPINYTDNIVWGKPTIVWNDAIMWDNLGKVDVLRRMPGKAMRSDMCQFQLVPASVAVYASSVDYPALANAAINATTKTATIQTPSGYSAIIWPLDVVGYVIAFQTDNYVNEYSIVSLTGTNTIITYSDSSNLSVTNATGVPWVIRGVKKMQRIKLSSINVHYAYMGDQVQIYPGTKSNQGPGNGGENPT